MSCRCMNGMNNKNTNSSLMKIISKIPSTPSYSIEPLSQTQDKQKNNSFNFTLLSQNNITYPWLTITPLKIQTLGRKIPLLYIKNKNASSDSITILYSHGIRTDLGLSYGFLLDLSTMLKCNIISYDYNLNANTIKKKIEVLEEILIYSIDPVLEYITHDLSISTKHLVLMSHSFGVIPITYITSSEECRNILGLILISPLTTIKACKELVEESNMVVQSFYNISCNVFIIHGQNDDVVNYKASKKLCSYIKNCESYFPGDAGHDDIFLGSQREIVYSKLRQFMEMLPVSVKRSLKRIKSNASSLNDLNSTKTSGDSNVDNNNNNNTIKQNLLITKNKDDNNTNNHKYSIGSMYPSLENNFLM